jgi:hypothetical protein
MANDTPSTPEITVRKGTLDILSPVPAGVTRFVITRAGRHGKDTHVALQMDYEDIDAVMAFVEEQRQSIIAEEHCTYQDLLTQNCRGIVEDFALAVNQYSHLAAEEAFEKYTEYAQAMVALLTKIVVDQNSGTNVRQFSVITGVIESDHELHVMAKPRKAPRSLLLGNFVLPLDGSHRTRH